MQTHTHAHTHACTHARTHFFIQCHQSLLSETSVLKTGKRACIQQQKSDMKVCLTLPKRKVLMMNMHSMVKTPEANYVQEFQRFKDKHAAEFKRQEKKDRANLTTPVPFTPDVVGRCNHMLNYVNLKVLSVFGSGL